MSFENSGADYLRQLQGNTPREDPPASNERRKNPRYKCEGSAQFRVQGSDVSTWGTLTDISMGGCYVEMMATFPVGATVELVLELNGLRARVVGEIRVSYPCLGMGIAFRQVSDEDQVRLLEMLRALGGLAPKADATPGPVATGHSTLPIIVNAAAALQALAEYFETHNVLSHEDFVRVLRSSQGSDDFRDNRR
jgi:hypothetical protein